MNIIERGKLNEPEVNASCTLFFDLISLPMFKAR